MSDRKVIQGVRNAVAARGRDWRYPNGAKDGNDIDPAPELDPQG